MQASCARDQGGTESTNQALSKSANKGNRHVDHSVPGISYSNRTNVLSLPKHKTSRFSSSDGFHIHAI